jgi:exosortase/archaeosortase family protein
MAVERGAIQSLTQFVVGANTVVLQSSGYAAQADGNVITIGACEVGVEEACSGIRSLQSTGMLALFVGAFWQLSWLRRATLLVIAAGAAFGFNLARALALSLIVFHGGEEPYARWHDTVGYVALFACIGTLFAVAWWLSRSAAGSVRETTTPAPALLSASTGGRRNAAAMACAFGVVCVAPEAFAAWWYRSATENEPRRDIAVSWPIDSGYEVTSLEIDPRIRDILEFDHGERVIVRGTDAIADAWFYRFDADASGRSIAAYVHSPTVCMTAGGARLVATRDRLDVDLGPFSLPFEHYTFRASARNGGGEIEVFWCMWDGGLEIADPNGGFRHAFVSAILGRRRDVGRKVLLVAVHARGGVDSRRELTRLARASVTPLVDGEPVRLR